VVSGATTESLEAKRGERLMTPELNLLDHLRSHRNLPSISTASLSTSSSNHSFDSYIPGERTRTSYTAIDPLPPPALSLITRRLTLLLNTSRAPRARPVRCLNFQKSKPLASVSQRTSFHLVYRPKPLPDLLAPLFSPCPPTQSRQRQENQVCTGE
jgi:hypothetical protein